MVYYSIIGLKKKNWGKGLESSKIFQENFDNPIKDPNPKDDTFKRIINNAHTGFYKTNYCNYWDFSFPEKKYKYEGEEEKEFNKFILNKMEINHQKSNFKEPISLFDPTVKNTIVP